MSGPVKPGVVFSIGSEQGMKITSSSEKVLASANQLLQAGNLGAAEGLIVQLLSMAPDDTRALYCLSIIRYQQGKAEAGIELLQKTISLQPNFTDAHNLLGILLHNKGELQIVRQVSNFTHQWRQ